MTVNELRQKYLEFFKSKGHAEIPGASLIPENDPTVLFTTAGMHPLVPYLLGEKHPSGNKLVSIQKCIRTGDIDEVGDEWHLTFFEMLGNWSLGDYFKKEAIEWSWEFLTDKKWLGIDQRKLSVTVFGGDQKYPHIPKDDETAEIWKSIGMPENRIAYMPGGVLEREDNWWGPAGITGPCGPSSEMFYWQGKSEFPPPNSNPGNDKNNWLEIWNDVFLQYNKTADEKFEPLKQKSVDTGMGLERTIAALNGLSSVYETETLQPLIKKIIKMVSVPESQQDEFYQSNKKAIRVIADHVRAATFILGDYNGVTPSNLGRGYILRRLIRRAIRYGKLIGLDINKDFLTPLAATVIELHQATYPELAANKVKIDQELIAEQDKFKKTLDMGLKEFNKMIKNNKLSGEECFVLFSTYGFPLEMTRELAQEKGIVIDEKCFNQELQKHQELSRTAAAGMFKGGLADASEETKRLHTAAHLMLQALRQVLGDHVSQKGSNITAERLRFDFTQPAKMTPEQIQEVENIVNAQIQKQLSVHFEEMSVEEAKQVGAVGVFEHKYGERVKVYFVGDKGAYFSKEICGGPHVTNTKELGHFKITKEESVSAGVRRIKAVLE